MVIVFIKMRSLPEKCLELKQTLKGLVVSARNEKGCLNYDLFQDVENENSFCLVEQWESRKDLDGHLQSNTFAVIKGTRSLLSIEADIRTYEASHSERSALKSLPRSG